MNERTNEWTNERTNHSTNQPAIVLEHFVVAVTSYARGTEVWVFFKNRPVNSSGFRAVLSWHWAPPLTFWHAVQEEEGWISAEEEGVVWSLSVSNMSPCVLRISLQWGVVLLQSNLRFSTVPYRSVCFGKHPLETQNFDLTLAGRALAVPRPRSGASRSWPLCMSPRGEFISVFF